MLSSALIGCFTVILSVIILSIICRHQGATINMWGTETAFKCTMAFYFHFRDRTNSVYTMKWQYLPHILQNQMFISGAQDL